MKTITILFAFAICFNSCKKCAKCTTVATYTTYPKTTATSTFDVCGQTNIKNSEGTVVTTSKVGNATVTITAVTTCEVVKEPFI